LSPSPYLRRGGIFIVERVALLVFLAAAAGAPRRVSGGGLDQQGQTHQKIIMPLARVDVEIHGLVRPVLAPCPLHLYPELLVLCRPIGGIHFKPAGIDSGQQVKAQLRLRLGGKGEAGDPGPERFPQEREYWLANAGGVDHHLAAAPDRLQYLVTINEFYFLSGYKCKWNKI
jgi:hypothetical protein